MIPTLLLWLALQGGQGQPDGTITANSFTVYDAAPATKPAGR